MINKLKKHVRWMSALLVASLLFGCGDGKQKESDGLIRVDVSKSYPKKELILQDLFDIEYVPLETTDEFVTAGNVRVVDKDLIITKNNGRTDGDIFLFDRTTGKGIRKINRLGQGGEEYNNILEIVLDKDRQELFINNHYSHKIKVYDLNGQFKRDFEQRENYFYDEMGVFDKDWLICHDGYSNFDKEETKRNFFMLVSKQDGHIVEIPIPYDKVKNGLILKRENGRLRDWSIRNKRLIHYKDGWLLNETSSDTIYHYSKDKGLVPFIVRTPSVQVMSPEIFLFPNVLTDRYCFMQVAEKEFNFDVDKDVERRDLVYDRISDEVFEVELYNDDFTEKIPVKIMFDLFMLSFVNNEEIAFTRILSAYELVEAYNDGKLRGPLKDIASKIDEEDNPVILIAKYKR